MRRNQMLCLLLVACLLAFAACAPTEADEPTTPVDPVEPDVPDEPEEPTLSGAAAEMADFLARLDEAEGVDVYVDTTSAMFVDSQVYAPASADEAQALLAYFSDIDLAVFSEVSDDEAVGTAHTLRVRMAEQSYVLRVLAPMPGLSINGADATTDAQYLTLDVYKDKQALMAVPFEQIMPEDLMDERLFTLKGPVDALDAQGLMQAIAAVTVNDSDTENLATVATVGQEDAVHTLTKGTSFYWENALNGMLYATPLDSEPDGTSYSTIFTMGEATYHIDMQSGVFSKPADGAVQYGQMDARWLMNADLFLAVPEGQ